MNVDQTTIDIFKKYGGDARTDLWEFKRGGQSIHIAKHKALERIAAKAGITFDQPHVFESNLAEQIVGVTVTGHLGENTAWSMGEAAPYNNKMGYPAAMAEKRAKDRVILKLLGIHGEVYSDIEADDFKQSKSPSKSTAKTRMGKAKSRETYTRLQNEMRQILNKPALLNWCGERKPEIERMELSFEDMLRDEVAEIIARWAEDKTGGTATVKEMEKA